jgi:sugar phosphate isomerase/epimerase
MKLKIGALVNMYGDLKTELELIRSCGYDYAEFGLSAPEKFVQEYAEKYEEYGKIIPVSAAHMRTVSFDEDEVEKSKNFISEHLKINCRNFVFHFYTSQSPVGDGLAEKKIFGLRELADFAEKQEVNLILENTYGVRVKELEEIFDKVKSVRFCLDIGHANLTGGTELVLDLFDNFSYKLKHIHAHDNFGGQAEMKNDMHMPVGTGKIDFPAIFKKLKEIEYSGSITSEVHDSERTARQTSIKAIKRLLS